MTSVPVLCGAALACALGGAIAGDALGSASPIDRSTLAMLYQSHETAISAADEPALPNHYSLVTNGRVVPVAELSDRGLFAQARYRPVYYIASHSMAATDLATEPDHADAAPLATPPPTTTQAEAANPPPPIELAQGPAQVAGQGKIIDVEEALALR